ncbi:hypothetical protein DMN91_009698 [Ooceraea biroi]|uniref:Uncharacterized protein n=1 Tax=Ooceraea biroi TaxID=2015173 RepID=A0A3L8DBI0_OOCBI|nr:hypothetical protein DMN91_009698 [Ooceraea biroi]
MLLSRTTRIFQQYLQRNRPLAVGAFYAPECSGYKERTYKHEYEQKRDFKDFGHTKTKVNWGTAIPYAVCSLIMMSLFFDWSSYFKGKLPTVDAAGMLVENESQSNESLEAAEQESQKKRKNKKQKIGFRDRKV